MRNISLMVISTKQTIATISAVSLRRCFPLNSSEPEMSIFLLDTRLIICSIFSSKITTIHIREAIHNAKIRMPSRLFFSAVDLTDNTLLNVLQVSVGPSAAASSKVLFSVKAALNPKCTEQYELQYCPFSRIGGWTDQTDPGCSRGIWYIWRQ